MSSLPVRVGVALLLLGLAAREGAAEQARPSARQAAAKQRPRAAPRPPTRAPARPALVLRAPRGAHVATLAHAGLLLDGRRVTSQIVVGAPVWRDDGRALAWLERTSIGLCVVVLPDVSRPTELMPFAAPAASQRDRLFWSGRTRVLLGAGELVPRAVISWTEAEPDAWPTWLRALPAAFTTTVDLRRR